MFRAVLAAAFAAMVSARCLPYSSGTCFLDNKTCDRSFGATTCYQGACVCLPGYCGDSQGVCRGCTNFSLDARVAAQSAKTGTYQLVQGGWVGERPVWKQTNGVNMVYYCTKYGNWIMTDKLPQNNPACEGGVASVQTTALTPFDVKQPWKFFDGAAWRDDTQYTVISYRCNDRYLGAPNPLKAIEETQEEEEELEPIRIEAVMPSEDDMKLMLGAAPARDDDELEPIRIIPIKPGKKLAASNTVDAEDELEPIRIEPIMPTAEDLAMFERVFKTAHTATEEEEEDLEPIRIEPVMPALKNEKKAMRGAPQAASLAEAVAQGGAGEPFVWFM